MGVSLHPLRVAEPSDHSDGQVPSLSLRTLPPPAPLLLRWTTPEAGPQGERNEKKCKRLYGQFWLGRISVRFPEEKSSDSKRLHGGFRVRRLLVRLCQEIS